MVSFVCCVFSLPSSSSLFASEWLTRIMYVREGSPTVEGIYVEKVNECGFRNIHQQHCLGNSYLRTGGLKCHDNACSNTIFLLEIRSWGYPASTGEQFSFVPSYKCIHMRAHVQKFHEFWFAGSYCFACKYEAEGTLVGILEFLKQHYGCVFLIVMEWLDLWTVVVITWVLCHRWIWKQLPPYSHMRILSCASHSWMSH